MLSFLPFFYVIIKHKVITNLKVLRSYQASKHNRLTLNANIILLLLIHSKYTKNHWNKKEKEGNITNFLLFLLDKLCIWYSFKTTIHIFKDSLIFRTSEWYCCCL